MIKTTTWGPDTCGCTISYDWDDEVPQAEITHTNYRIVKKCPIHQNVSPEEHSEVVKEENARKNIAYGEVKEAYPDAEIAWEFNSKRELTLNVKNVSFIDSEALLAKIGDRVELKLV